MQQSNLDVVAYLDIITGFLIFHQVGDEGNIEISVHTNQIKELNLYNNRETKAIV